MNVKLAHNNIVEGRRSYMEDRVLFNQGAPGLTSLYLRQQDRKGSLKGANSRQHRCRCALPGQQQP